MFDFLLLYLPVLIPPGSSQISIFQTTELYLPADPHEARPEYHQEYTDRH